MNKTTTTELESIGRLCGLLQRTPNAIRTAADSIGEMPVLVLNGVAHYSTEQAERIAAHFRTQQDAPALVESRAKGGRGVKSHK